MKNITTPEYSRFKVGNIVKVISCGQVYSSYSSMAEVMGLDIRKFENSRHMTDRRIKQNRFTVKSVRNHEDGDSILYAIENNTWLVIINEMVLGEIMTLPEELFEI